MARALVDCSRIHGGGAVQVAASFLDETADLVRERHPLACWPTVLQFEVSTAVAAQLSKRTIDSLNVRLGDRRPTDLAPWLPKPRSFDVSFVVFGPEYGYPRAGKRIVGFADVTSVFTRPPELPERRTMETARMRLRAGVSRWLHSKADLLVVESRAIADELASHLREKMPPVVLVPNTINGVFAHRERWSSVALPEVPTNVELISYVARGHDYKNHRVLSDVARECRAQADMEVRFVVTLTSTEWNRLTRSQTELLINVGPLSISQVPTLLARSDAVIFPSLLESCSASPIEALYMNKLLCASDLPFVRESCGDAPIYFNPTSPPDIARAIVSALSDSRVATEHRRRTRRVLAGIITPRERALAYLEAIAGVVATAHVH